MKNGKKIIAIILLVILIIVVIVSRNEKLAINDNKTYYNEMMSFGFSYPSGFVVEEVKSKGDPIQPIIINLVSPDRKTILIVPSVRSKTDIDKEKEFYESLLFGNPDQTVNYRSTIKDFTGFRSAIPNAFKSLLTLYKDLGEDKYMTIRSELNASSTPLHFEVEDDFKLIIESMIFDQKNAQSL